MMIPTQSYLDNYYVRERALRDISNPVTLQSYSDTSKGGDSSPSSCLSRVAPIA
jgi:hypothetical protein